MTKVNTDAKLQMIKKFITDYDKKCPVEQLIIICLGQLYKDFALRLLTKRMGKEDGGLSKKDALLIMIEASRNLNQYLIQAYDQIESNEEGKESE